ncbi:Os04g0296301, partial [Oryza sativa Japonica Group]
SLTPPRLLQRCRREGLRHRWEQRVRGRRRRRREPRHRRHSRTTLAVHTFFSSDPTHAGMNG